jgi:predicted outer membrane repeat protein
VIRNNRGRGSGGGVYIWAYLPDIVHIERTVVEGNTVAAVTDGGSLGGGMRVSNGEITITASSILSNHSESHGGGLYLDCAPTCTITNTTFFDNEARPSVGDGAGYGGAIFGGGYRLGNVTFAQNYAAGHGGALFGGADAVIENSLFVDNASGNPWNQARSCGDTATGSNVLQWQTTDENGGDDHCIPTIIEADPALAPSPADNGGPTPTLLPGAGSAALQAGSDCESVDQRGEPRDPNACDLGAVEIQ